MIINKRGQVTIFIIIAILVVAIVAVIFMIPKLRKGIGIGKVESPENFIQTCLEDTIKENIETISLQGGSLEPEPYYLYQGNNLQYLCYTNDYYTPCTVQIPFLRDHVEDEIKKSIEEDVDFCFNSLKEKYKDSSLKKGEIKIDLLPQRILTTINNTFVFTIGDDTKRLESFKIVLNNNLYELVAIAQNIVEWEVVYGEAEPDLYMELYHDLKVEKYPQEDETYVYVVTYKDTDDRFQFASRSLAYAPY